MKNVFLAVLFVLSLTTVAQVKQTRSERLTPEEKIDLQVKRMTKDLGLNEKQVAEVRAIVTKQVQHREEMKAELKATKEKQRKEMKGKIEREQEAIKTEYKKILTPEQFAQWEKKQEAQKEKVKDRMIERKEKKDLK